jgi:hypothetical protein
MASIVCRLENGYYVRQPEGMIGSVLALAPSGQFMDQPFLDGAAYTDWQMSTSSFLGERHFPAKLRLAISRRNGECRLG